MLLRGGRLFLLFRVAATFKWPTLSFCFICRPLSSDPQKERDPELLPGLVWFRVPKTAPQLLANSGGGLGHHSLVGICEGYYGDLGCSQSCGPSQQSAKQTPLGAGKRFQLAQIRSNFGCAGFAEINSGQCPVVGEFRLASGLLLNRPGHKSSWILYFINGLERPVLKSIDMPHFAPIHAREQYPQGEPQVYFL
jgi:hypothetical protein